MEESAVDRHNFAAHQVERARQQHERPIRSLERSAVFLTEVRYRAIAGYKPAQQPDQLQISLSLALQTSRGADLIEVAVQIQLQQIRWIIGRLPGPSSAPGVAKP